MYVYVHKLLTKGKKSIHRYSMATMKLSIIQTEYAFVILQMCAYARTDVSVLYSIQRIGEKGFPQLRIKCSVPKS